MGATLAPLKVERETLPDKRDEAIAEWMPAERSGILNWCLAGLREDVEAGWYRRGAFAV